MPQQMTYLVMQEVLPERYLADIFRIPTQITSPIIIGQITAGGYVGDLEPGNVANVLGDTGILGVLLMCQIHWHH